MAWADSPTVDTGFGVVSKNLLNRFIEMGHEVAVLGINEYGDRPREEAKFPGIIYPCERGGPEQVYGFHRFWPIVAAEQPDLLFLLNDPWLIENIFQVMPEGFPHIKTIAYYPTDGAPLKPSWLKTLNTHVDEQVCYSHYAEDVVSKSNGDKRPKNLTQIYHGVDRTIFRPVNQSVARAEVGVPQDAFIVGMVARNQPRKRFDALAMGFAQFAKDKDPDKVKLMFHTGLRDIGYDILDLARQLNIADKLILTEDIMPNKGVSPQTLNLIYNSLDVHALFSLGDGFGLPVAESMAVGCPQLVSGHSCLKELVDGHGGLTVKTATWAMNASGMNTWGGFPDIPDITKKLQILYDNPEQRRQYGEDGYRFITQPQFSWDYAANEFDKLFKKVHHILDVKGERNARVSEL